MSESYKTFFMVLICVLGVISIIQSFAILGLQEDIKSLDAAVFVESPQ